MGADSADVSSGQVALVNCTLTANGANGGTSTGGEGGSGFGGAVFNLDGQATLAYDTLALNEVDGVNIIGDPLLGADGGAVYNLAYGNDIPTNNPVTATITLVNSILATSVIGNDLVSKAMNSQGTNTAVIGSDHSLVMSHDGTPVVGIIVSTANPELGPLQNNGGLTQTMLPQPGSPVLGAGDLNFSTNPGNTDQRGHRDRPAAPTTWGPSRFRPHRAVAAVRRRILPRPWDG